MGLSRQVRLSLLGAAAVAALGWAVLRPDEMYVERIDFQGNERATDAELRHLSDLRNGVTIWEVDLPTLSERVQRHPWVASVVAERRMPGTIVVKVQEHEPAALLAFGQRLYYVDETGGPFLEARSDDLDHPVISGIDAALEQLHPRLPGLVLHDALWLLHELDARAILPHERVSEISFHRTRGFVVQAAGSVAGGPTAEVLIGLGDYERQLRHLAALVERGVDFTRPLHIDVAPETVAIVRPRGAPAGLPVGPDGVELPAMAAPPASVVALAPPSAAPAASAPTAVAKPGPSAAAKPAPSAPVAKATPGSPSAKPGAAAPKPAVPKPVNEKKPSAAPRPGGVAPPSAPSAPALH
jgi:hypothetical protein